MQPKKLQYICEVCGRREILTQDEARNSGWDYPPFIGFFGVLSPRTCPQCPISKTLWFRVTYGMVDVDALSERDIDTLRRIEGEPYNMFLENNT